jgi:DnaJ-class molecular chaperone
MSSPYQTLGVSPYADVKDIKKAYRLLARKYHPDQNSDPEAVSKFQEIQEAYRLITDKSHKPQVTAFSGFDDFPDISDWGADIDISVSVSFEEALLGKIVHPLVADKREEIFIPPGTTDGEMLRLRGRGASGVSPGDLFVKVSVRQSNYFIKEGLNVICEVPLTIAEAALGSEVRVPTLAGSKKIKIRSGTQQGQLVRLRDEGFTGSIIYRFMIISPDIENQQIKSALEIIDQLSEDPRKDWQLGQ